MKKDEKFYGYLMMKIILAVIVILFAEVIFANSQNNLDFSPSGARILSLYLGNIRVWEKEGGNFLWETKTEGRGKWLSAVFINEGKYILAISDDNKADWLDADTGKVVHRSEVSEGTTFTVSADRKRLAVLNDLDVFNEKIHLYKIAEAGKLLKIKSKLSSSGTKCFNFDENGRNLLILGLRSQIFSLETGKSKRLPAINNLFSCALSSSSDKVIFARRFYGKGLKPGEINAKSLKMRWINIEKKFSLYLSDVNLVKYSPNDDSIVFIAGTSSTPKLGALLIFNSKTGKVIRYLLGKGSITDFKISSDGEAVLYQDLAGEVFWVDIKTGENDQKYLVPNYESETNKAVSG